MERLHRHLLLYLFRAYPAALVDAGLQRFLAKGGTHWRKGSAAISFCTCFNLRCPSKRRDFKNLKCCAQATRHPRTSNAVRKDATSSFRATALVPQRASTFTIKQRRPLAIKSVPSRYLFPSKCTFRLIRPILLFTAAYTYRAQPVQRTLLDKPNHDHLPSSWSRLPFPSSFPCNRRAADLLLTPRHERTVSRVT